MLALGTFGSCQAAEVGSPATPCQTDRSRPGNSGEWRGQSWQLCRSDDSQVAANTEIRPGSVGSGVHVLSSAATGYVDSEALRAHVALELLVDTGADLERARAIGAAQH